MALVDDEDFDSVNQYTWDVLKSKNNPNVVYARRNFQSGGIKSHLLMHRYILKLDTDDIVDHIDRNGLNNQKSNLRLCTRSQNAANKKVQKNRKYKGVRKRYPLVKYTSRVTGETTVYTRPESYLAFVIKDGKNYYGGEYPTQEEAAVAYNILAKELYGDYALLNVIE